MKCATCRHCRPHMRFQVCRAPSVLEWQRTLNGSSTGLHVDIAWGWCAGKRFEVKQ